MSFLSSYLSKKALQKVGQFLNTSESFTARQARGLAKGTKRTVDALVGAGKQAVTREVADIRRGQPVPSVSDVFAGGEAVRKGITRGGVALGKEFLAGASVISKSILGEASPETQRLLYGRTPEQTKALELKVFGRETQSLQESFGQLKSFAKKDRATPFEALAFAGLGTAGLGAIESPLGLPGKGGKAVAKLAKEAKKFKTAEEFVKAQGDTFFHTTGAKFTNFDNKFLGSNTGDIADNVDRGFFFSDSIKNINDFKKTLTKGKVNFMGEKLGAKDVSKFRTIEKVIDKSKFFQLNELAIMNGKLPVKDAEILSKIFGTEDGKVLKGQKAVDHVVEVIDQQRGDLSEFWDEAGDEFIKKIKSKGYVGFKTNFGGGVNEYVVLEPNKLPDKSQLTDIFNKVKREATAKRSLGIDEFTNAPIKNVKISDIEPNQRAFLKQNIVDDVFKNGVKRPVILEKTASGIKVVNGNNRIRGSFLRGDKTVPSVFQDEIPTLGKPKKALTTEGEVKKSKVPQQPKKAQVSQVVDDVSALPKEVPQEPKPRKLLTDKGRVLVDEKGKEITLNSTVKEPNPLDKPTLISEAKSEKKVQNALENVGKKHGETENIIKSLENAGLSKKQIDDIVLEDGTRLIDTVKVKREKNGVLSAVITKQDLAEIKTAFKGYKGENVWHRTDTLKFKTREMSKGLQEMYELPQVYFTRLGLKDKLYSPIRQAENNAELMKRGMFKQFEDAGLMKRSGVFTADRFKISSKEAKHITEHYLKVQGKLKKEVNLTPKEQKFVDVFDKIKKESEERFYTVARKNGKEPGKVENYSPLYTRGELSKIEEVGDLSFIFRRHPAFASLKKRVKEVPLNLYEPDYRKVVSAWVNGISNFTHMGDAVGDVKYLINSNQFKDIVGDRVHKVANNWLRDITTPKPLTPVENISRFGRKVSALASLGLSYASVLKQALTLIPITIIEKAPPKLKSTFAKDFGISVKDLPAITSRKGDIAIADMQEGISKAFLGPLTAFDQKNAQISLNGLLDKEYKKFLKTGKPITKETEQLIINEASDIMEMWFGGMSKSQLPPAFRSEIGKAINMFIYPLTSQLNGFVYAVAKSKGMKRPQKVAEVLTAVIAIAYMEQAITSMSPKWSDEKEMTKDVLKSMAGNIPLISQIVYAFATENPLNLLTATGGVSNALKKVSRYTKGQSTESDVAFALAEMFGLPKTARRFKEGAEIYSEEGIRDKNGKLLAPIDGEDHIRAFLRGKYGTVAGKDYIRNVGVKKEDRRWFVPEVEFIQNGDYERKADLYSSFDKETQDSLYNELSERQQKKLDKELRRIKSGSRARATNKKPKTKAPITRDELKSILLQKLESGEITRAEVTRKIKAYDSRY